MVQHAYNVACKKALKCTLVVEVKNAGHAARYASYTSVGNEESFFADNV
jgi:hypothetical protein